MTSRPVANEPHPALAQAFPPGIHPTAIIDPGAEIGEDCHIGAYAWIGSGVRLGKGNIVHHHASLEGNTVLGEGNEIFPYALIGGRTHDLKYRGGNPGLRIGNRNVFREYVTIHLATGDGDWTEIGDDCNILAYSHIAHDCRIGNHLVMSSHAALGGHVVIGDYVNIAWGTGVHQFCRIGSHAMVGACSKLVQDVLPLMLADGNPAVVRTVNRVGLQRHGYGPEDLEVAREIHRLFYREGINRMQARERLQLISKSQHSFVQLALQFTAGEGRGLA